MSYAINCSVSEIENFKQTQSDNLNEIDGIFCAKDNGIIFTSYQYGGLFGEMYNTLRANQRMLEETAKESLGMIEYDLMQARNTRQHDREVIERIVAEIEKTQKMIAEQQEQARKCSEQLRKCKEEQTKLNNTTVPSLGDSEEAKKAQSAMKRQLAQNKQAVQNSLNAAQKNYSDVQSSIANLKRYEQELVAKKERVEEIIKTLENFLTQTEGRRSEIGNYVDRCKLAMEKIDALMKSAAANYRKTEDALKTYDEVATAAEELAETIGKNLALTADKTYSYSDKIKVDSPKTLYNTAGALRESKSDIENYSLELLDLIERVGALMKDNVVVNTSKRLNASQQAITHESSPFDGYSNCFRKAANALTQYTKL